MTFNEGMLPDLNAYRQACHAFHVAQEQGSPDAEQKRRARDEAARHLADGLRGYVRAMHQEPDDWVILPD